MTNPMIKIVNVETDEVIVREMTNEELVESQNAQAEHNAVVAKQEDEKAKIAMKRQALLDKLGITAEEAKLLLS